jgi:hypothetical protein
VPGTVPQSEVRKRLLNLQKMELTVEKARREASGEAVKKQGVDDIEVRYAMAAAAVAKAEWQQAVEANQKVPGTVPQTEVRKRLLEMQKMEFAIEKAKKDMRSKPAAGSRDP